MHNIQRHVLKLLIENDSQRYSQLRPERAEPNQFVYHLKQLISVGLVTKCTAGYELTAKGRAYADRLEDTSLDMSWDTGPRNVLFLAVFDEKLGWLLVRRDKQPTFGRIGFISANMRLGESITQTAERQLQSDYGLKASFSYVSSGSVTIYRDSDLESYVVFHLLYAQNPVGICSADNAHWMQLADMDNTAVLPSTRPLSKLIQASDSDRQFIELNFKEF